LSDEREIFAFNFDDSDKSLSNSKESVRSETEFELKHAGLLNGMAMWYEVDYSRDRLDDELTINTGLVEAPRPQQHLVWNKNFRQAVTILDQKHVVDESNMAKLKVKCFVNFELKAGNFTVDFKVQS
jgi:hypothetical protein